MKALKLLLIIKLSTTICCAQTDKLSLIKAPSSPSSVIIGTQPSTISRPKSWEAVEATVFGNYTNQNGSLLVPNDFSIEVTPYWLNSKSKIELDKFLTRNVGTSLLQNLSLSVSSTKNFIVNDTIKTDAMGFGFRTMFFQGAGNSIQKMNSINKLTSLSQGIFAIANGLAGFSTKDEFIEKLITALENTAALTAELASINNASKDTWQTNLRSDLKKKLPNDISKLVDSTSDIVDDLLKVDQSLQDLTNLGFRLELAGALSLNFPTNATEFSYVPKYGLWITPSYSIEKFEFLGVLRYFWYNEDYYNAYQPKQSFFNNNLDYGGRLVYKRDKFSVEAEIIGRSSKTIIERTTDSNGITTVKSKSESDAQYVINFNYRINDSIVLSYNFGRKFSPSGNSQNTLISVATLNFGIGAPRKENIE
ncbi:MAG: hypothetical protein WDN75_20300 [Bacteroidota bacterium]